MQLGSAVKSAPAQPGGASNTVATPSGFFVRAAHEVHQPFNDTLTQIGASAKPVGPLDVASMGFMRSIILHVATDGTGAGGSAAGHEDSPWRALENIQLSDTNGRPIVGPLNGYDLYLINKWGAQGGVGSEYDPAELPSYSGVDANGEFSFAVRIPVEITSRDGVGSLPNLSSSATYKLHYTIAAESVIYTTAPVTTTPAVRVKATLEAWSQPPAQNPLGYPNKTEPDASGTTSYWSATTHNISPGQQRVPIKRMGNLIRNLIYVFRNDAGSPVRNSAEFPDQTQIHWDNKIADTYDKEVWVDQMYERFGQTPDEGVFVSDFTHDSDGRPGNENRHLYLPTVQGTRYELNGIFDGGGVLTIITNDVAPAQGAPSLSSGNA